jgi:hypothetical protein
MKPKIFDHPTLRDLISLMRANERQLLAMLPVYDRCVRCFADFILTPIDVARGSGGTSYAGPSTEAQHNIQAAIASTLQLRHFMVEAESKFRKAAKPSTRRGSASRSSRPDSRELSPVPDSSRSKPRQGLKPRSKRRRKLRRKEDAQNLPGT